MEDKIQQFNFFVSFGLPLIILVATYFIGSWVEKKHFKRIQAREADLLGFPVVSFDTMPENWRVNTSDLVVGNVVVSLDYFKRVIAGLRALIGGRIKTYEPLLDRARREAMLRMTEEARSQGYDAVYNVRLETSRLASSRGDGKGTAGIEMLAYGTAVKFVSRFANAR